MAKKPRRRRSSLRAATKVQERGLQALADRLGAEPGLALPSCQGHGSHFKRAQKAVMKAWAARDDQDRLAKLAKRGHLLARAYAATMLMGQTDDQVIMLQVNTPFGKVPVASRGKAKALHLVALQHLDDRKLRLMGVVDLVRRKRLHFYSMPGGGVVCAGRSPAPPAQFVQAEAQALGLIKDPDGWGCPHAIHAPERLTLRWRAAGTSLRKCAACAREGNMLHTIVQHMAGPRLLDGFDVEVELAPLPAQGSKPAQVPRSPPLDAAALEKYRKGELDDPGLLAAQRAARLAQLRTLPGPLYVNSGVSYGADLDAFLASMSPTPLEAAALRGALDGHERAVVQERGTPSKLLAEVWDERGRAALEAVAGSAAIAEEIHKAHDVAAKGVGPALQQAQARGLRAQTDSALPTYRDLPVAARLADRVARAHRANGKAAALAALEGADDPRMRSIAHAFELALGAGQGKEWKYTPHEQDLARTLKLHAAALLEAEPARYHEALQALARAAGVSEDLRRA